MSASLILALTYAVVTSKRDVTSSGCQNVTYSSTLVVHIFADTDPEYLPNLNFFVQHGISSRDSADYVIIVQTNSSDVVS